MYGLESCFSVWHVFSGHDSFWLVANTPYFYNKTMYGHNMVVHHHCPIIFCKAKVRPWSYWSYPIQRPCMVLFKSSLRNLTLHFYGCPTTSTTLTVSEFPHLFQFSWVLMLLGNFSEGIHSLILCAHIHSAVHSSSWPFRVSSYRYNPDRPLYLYVLSQ